MPVGGFAIDRGQQFTKPLPLVLQGHRAEGATHGADGLVVVLAHTPDLAGLLWIEGEPILSFPVELFAVDRHLIVAVLRPVHSFGEIARVGSDLGGDDPVTNVLL